MKWFVRMICSFVLIWMNFSVFSGWFVDGWVVNKRRGSRAISSLRCVIRFRGIMRLWSKGRFGRMGMLLSIMRFGGIT